MWWKLNLVLVVQHVPGALVSPCILPACVLGLCDALWGTGIEPGMGEIGSLEEENDFPGKGNYDRKR